MKNSKFLLLPFLFLFIVALQHDKIYRNRYPRIMGEKLSNNAINPFRRKTQKKIVSIHNFFRSKVRPAAANMLKMQWNTMLAKAAQRWSSNCEFLIHDNPYGRFVKNYGPCGQNIFVATQKVPWLFAIKTWFLEYNYFEYGKDNNKLKDVGHYTQMVWAATHQIGCGLSKCASSKNDTFLKYYSYICNYCPIGNLPNKLGTPYIQGNSCTLCKNNCFKNKLCTNSCNMSDNWWNCNEIYKRFPKWLCFSYSKVGKERLTNCLATCKCGNKIHD